MALFTSSMLIFYIIFLLSRTLFFGVSQLFFLTSFVFLTPLFHHLLFYAEVLLPLFIANFDALPTGSAG